MEQPSYEKLKQSGMSPRKTLASGSKKKFPSDLSSVRKMRGENIYKSLKK